MGGAGPVEFVPRTGVNGGPQVVSTGVGVRCWRAWRRQSWWFFSGTGATLRAKSSKKKLAEAGIASRFQAGALVCAGSIVVRKASDDRGAARVVVDGPLCEDYYAVSRVVRNAFALV